MCQKAEENLVKKNYHLAPKFFFHKTLPKDEKEKAKQVSKKMGAKIVDSEEDATHILYPSTGKTLEKKSFHHLLLFPGEVRDILLRQGRLVQF